LFCSIDTCRGRCKGVTFKNPAMSIGDAMKKSGKNSNRGGKSVDRVKRARDSSAERDEEEEKKKEEEEENCEDVLLDDEER